MLLPSSRKFLRPLALLLFIFLAFGIFSGLPQLIDFALRGRKVCNDVPKADVLLEETTTTPPQSATKPKLGKHKYREDGLLETNFDAPHPIYELILRAEREWDAKLKRASRTLEEAVAEYKRRYSRLPPKGFDIWWKYATENNVQLPDEYDQIHHDLEAFWGLEPADLIAIHEENEKSLNTYTIGRNDTSDVEVVTYAFDEGRYDDFMAGSSQIINLLKPVQNDLPPFRMTLAPDDRPNRLTDYGVKEALLQAAEGNTYTSRSSLPKIHTIGWVSACPPDSPARLQKIDLDNPPPRPVKKTFIYDHVRSMDPCNHPDLLHHHGQFLSHNYGPSPQHAFVPEFSYCSTTIHHNIRIPVPYLWVEDLSKKDDPEFDDKLDERLLWRGRNTGIFYGPKTRWGHSQRNFLVGYANDFDGMISILQPNISRNEPVGEPRSLRKARINPALMDIAFIDRANTCSKETCELLEEIYPFREFQSLGEAGTYKYVIDVDGNGWSGRFKRLITSRSMILKSTIYPEWYADRVAPWVHYVPIQVDYSDLHDVLFFFRGDGNGDGAHEHLGRKIALAGREWSKTFWRKEDMTCYMFRLLLEYSRLMSLDRDAMSYKND